MKLVILFVIFCAWILSHPLLIHLTLMNQNDIWLLRAVTCSFVKVIFIFLLICEIWFFLCKTKSRGSSRGYPIEKVTYLPIYGIHINSNWTLIFKKNYYFSYFLKKPGKYCVKLVIIRRSQLIFWILALPILLNIFQNQQDPQAWRCLVHSLKSPSWHFQDSVKSEVAICLEFESSCEIKFLDLTIVF